MAFDNQYDVIIIGSGLGGLTTAALLSKSGKKVLVIEKHDRPGGYLQSFKRKGYHFDSSVHFSGGCIEMEENNKGAIFKTLKMLNVEYECTFLHTDPFMRFSLPDYSITLPADLLELEKKLCKDFPKEKKQIKKLLKFCLKMDNDLRRLPDNLNLLNKILMPFTFPRVVRFGNTTLNNGLSHFLKDKHLKAIFASLSACFAMPVEKVSFAMWSHILVSFFAEKVAYCKGTFQELANALVKGMESYSGKLLLNTTVESIEIENSTVTGVTLNNGTTVNAPVVISNADLRHTYEQLINANNVPEKYLQTIKQLKPSLSCFAIFAGTDLPLHTMDLSHENFIYDTPDMTKWYCNPDIKTDFNIIVSIPSITDPTVAPKGKHNISILSFIPYKKMENDERKEFTDFLLDEVEKIIPGLKKHIDFIETATPTTFERYTNNYKGSSLGWECSVDQVGDKRPSYQSPIHGLWHTGHWTKPGGGIYATIISGRNVAQRILGYKNVADFINAMDEID